MPAPVHGRGVEIVARAGAPVIAVNDGRIVRIGRSPRLGLHVQLRDVYGNTYTYAGLGQVVGAHPAADQGSSPGIRIPWLTGAPAGGLDASRVSEPVKQRLFANPTRPAPRAVLERVPSATGSHPQAVRAMPLKKGSRVIAGTTIGRLAEQTGGSAHMVFKIRPAGRGAPSIDPRPILEGWKLLESSAASPASGHNAALRPTPRTSRSAS